MSKEVDELDPFEMSDEEFEKAESKFFSEPDPEPNSEEEKQEESTDSENENT